MKFHHRIPGAKFYMPDGREIAFAGGSVDTAEIQDPVARKSAEVELTKIANSPSSMIYTVAPIKDLGERTTTTELEASSTQHFDQANKIPAGAVTTPMPMASDTHASVHTAMQSSAIVPEQKAPDLAASIEAARKAVAASGGTAAPAPKK